MMMIHGENNILVHHDGTTTCHPSTQARHDVAQCSGTDKIEFIILLIIVIVVVVVVIVCVKNSMIIISLDNDCGCGIKIIIHHR
jgi:hypothetical protein